MIKIRKAEAKDKDAFIRLEREFCEYNQNLELSNHLERKSCSDVPDSFFLNAFDALLVKNIFFHIAEINGEVIGCIEAEIVEPYEKERYERGAVHRYPFFKLSPAQSTHLSP